MYENPDAFELCRVDTELSPCAINNSFIFFECMRWSKSI